jgi:hypothetical protein
LRKIEHGCTTGKILIGRGYKVPTKGRVLIDVNQLNANDSRLHLNISDEFFVTNSKVLQPSKELDHGKN